MLLDLEIERTGEALEAHVVRADRLHLAALDERALFGAAECDYLVGRLLTEQASVGELLLDKRLQLAHLRGAAAQDHLVDVGLAEAVLGQQLIDGLERLLIELGAGAL